MIARPVARVGPNQVPTGVSQSVQADEGEGSGKIEAGLCPLQCGRADPASQRSTSGRRSVRTVVRSSIIAAALLTSARASAGMRRTANSLKPTAPLAPANLDATEAGSSLRWPESRPETTVSKFATRKSQARSGRLPFDAT